MLYQQLYNGLCDTTYYNDYCDDGKKCNVSGTGEIKDNGDLVIYNVTFDDEGFYYYSFHVDEDTPNTGEYYQQYLEVYGKL